MQAGVRPMRCPVCKKREIECEEHPMCLRCQDATDEVKFDKYAKRKGWDEPEDSDD